MKAPVDIGYCGVCYEPCPVDDPCCPWALVLAFAEEEYTLKEDNSYEEDQATSNTTYPQR